MCLYKHRDAGGPYLLMAAVMRLVECLVSRAPQKKYHEHLHKGM
jgi:hypothetical protein